jgi:hypothetical protein
MPGEPEPTAARAVDRSYPPELGRFGADDRALERLAAVGGGSVLEVPAAVVSAVEPTLVPRSLRQPAFITALILYLLSVLLLRLPDRAAATAATEAIRERSSKPPEPKAHPNTTKEAA